MTQQVKHTLRKSNLITESFFKARVADLVRKIQARHALGDQDLADLASCSPETIANARAGEHKLSAHTLFNLLTVDETCLEGLLHFFDRRSVPLSAKCDTDPLISTSMAVHKLAVAAAHNSSGKITDQECLGIEDALDAAIEGLCSLKSRCLDIKEGRNQ